MDLQQEQSKEKKILLNNVPLTEQEFSQKRKEIQEQKDVQLVEISNGVYKTRILG